MNNTVKTKWSMSRLKRNPKKILSMVKTFSGIISVLLCAFAFISSDDINTNIADSKYYTDSLYSNHLGEFRLHNIYLPADYDEHLKYPILYTTDGEFDLENSLLKPMLDSLISNQIIDPLIVVGSHANAIAVDGANGEGDNGSGYVLRFRNFEYVNHDQNFSENPALKNRFKNHMNYFTEELIDKIEQDLNLKSNADNRLFYGTSNGAGFGAELLNSKPNLIGTFILFSTAGSNVESNTWNINTRYPDLYLKYGSEESENFKKESQVLVQKYRLSNSFSNLKIYDGGHDYLKWHAELTSSLVEVFRNGLAK